MALLEILKYPDPKLRRKCKPVEQVTPELKEFAANMLETMKSFNGIGLAAAQVDRLDRLIVLDTRRPEGDDAEARYELGGETELEKKITQPLVLINPVIKKKQGKTTYNEGCLSVPSYFEVVERALLIDVEAMTLDGEKIAFQTDGLLAICIQHEIDHLDGKLFIDRLSPLKSSRVKAKIKKFGYPDPDEDDGENDVTDSHIEL
ncbi:MAG: peptide deformylase [Bdellovibrionales bacterium]|nr:peptide deformylase [Bdellovibrionales bacterium]